MGTIVFNGGEEHSRKLIPSFKNMKYVCRENENKDFDIKTEMTEDLDIFWYMTSICLPRSPAAKHSRYLHLIMINRKSPWATFTFVVIRVIPVKCSKKLRVWHAVIQ